MSFLGGYLVPLLAGKLGLGPTFSIGASTCLFSFLVSACFISLDTKAQNHDRLLIEQRQMALSHEMGASADQEDDVEGGAAALYDLSPAILTEHDAAEDG